MKTRVNHLYTLIMMSLLFTACQKDALVENISPENTIGESIETRSSSSLIEFEIWQYVEVNKLDLPPAPKFAKYSDEVDDEISKPARYYGHYGLTSESGQGYMMDYGRFLSTVELTLDPTKSQVNGIISLNFVSEGDRMVLKVMGDVSERETTDDGTDLTVQIVSIKGSGRFSHLRFYGKFTIVNSDRIFDGDAIDYNATFVVKGIFGK